MILEELYHGTIHPQETYRPMTDEHRMKRRELIAKQESLLKKLGEEYCDDLEDILAELDMVGAMQMKEIYIQGMRMGARLTMELLEEEEFFKKRYI